MKELENVQLEIIKKNIRRIWLRVKSNGVVSISAPKELPDSEIEAFIYKNIDFIKQQLENIQNISNTLEYRDNEIINIRGDKYILNINNKNKSQKDDCYLIEQEKKIILLIDENANLDNRRKLVTNLFRKLLKEDISNILPIWEEKTNLYCKEWKIKSMKSRWGTCNYKDKRIWFNLQLVHKSRYMLEYIILHELVHLVEPSHNKVFQTYMDKFMPEWREIRAKLNKSGLESIC